MGPTTKGASSRTERTAKRGVIRGLPVAAMIAGVSSAAVGAVLSMPAGALAGEVRGSVGLPLASTAAPSDPARARYWEEWNGVLDPRPMRPEPARELSVVLTGPGTAAATEQPPYRISNGALLPATIVTRVGGAIQLRNDDGVAYELFAEGFSEFGPIQTAPGNARPITLTEAGHWVIRDRLHPHVAGHLHAVPDLIARAFIDADGSYTFRDVPAGRYTLRVFRGADEVAHQDVTVAADAPLTIPAIALAVPPAAPVAGAPRP